MNQKAMDRLNAIVDYYEFERVYREMTPFGEIFVAKRDYTYRKDELGRQLKDYGIWTFLRCAEGDVLDIDIPKERRDENGLLVLVKEHDALQVAVTEARNFLEARQAVFGK